GENCKSGNEKRDHFGPRQRASFTVGSSVGAPHYTPNPFERFKAVITGSAGVPPASPLWPRELKLPHASLLNSHAGGTPALPVICHARNHALLKGQSSGLGHNLALTGLFSMYLTVAAKCFASRM